MVDLKVFDTYTELCENAFEYVISVLYRKPQAVMCVATGESPIGLYRLFNQQTHVFQDINVLKLDEWGGISPSDPSTCETYIKENIIQPLGLTESQLLGFKSDADDPNLECERVKGLIKQIGGIDLCVLGVGEDGHVGLNFPEETLIPEAHTVPASYLTHSMLDKAKEKPTHGYTLGMKEIVNSRNIMLIIKGSRKKEAMIKLMKGEITPHFPASFLLLSENLTVYSDREAFGE